MGGGKRVGQCKCAQTNQIRKLTSTRKSVPFYSTNYFLVYVRIYRVIYVVLRMLSNVAENRFRDFDENTRFRCPLIPKMFFPPKRPSFWYLNNTSAYTKGTRFFKLNTKHLSIWPELKFCDFEKHSLIFGGTLHEVLGTCSKFSQKWIQIISSNFL